jgi:hypothetical protein
MATFNQQNQRVHHQINGEQVYATPAVAPTFDTIECAIEDIIRRVRTDHECATVADGIISHLTAARVAASRGDQRSLLASLTRVAELAAPVAAIATSVAAIANGIAGIA